MRASKLDRTPFPLELTSYRLCVGLSLLIGLILSATRLLGVHRVESALALGVLMPPLSALAAARVVCAARRAGPVEELGAVMRRACAAGVSLLLIPTVVLALNALRVKQCDPAGGAAFMALGPGFGCLLASALACLLTCVTARGGLATALATLPPLGGLILSALEFYRTPAVFSYGHFFGYFPGSVYDELVEIPWALGYLRVASLCFLMAVFWLFSAYADRDQLLLGIRPRSNWLAAAGAIALSAGVALSAQGDRLGFRTSHQHIARELGGYLRSARCELFVPREMPDKERFGADCDFRVYQAERFFELTQPVPVRVYVFRDAHEKRRLMGAAGTNIAKPWRDEIYLQQSSWPHPVMAHEIAHVVVGQTGIGPFRIAGELGGLWPNPGIVEGMAVAAAFHPSAGLTPHQWARAMLELDMVPPLDSLLGSGFFGNSSRLSYTLAGSLLHFVQERDGARALRRIYRAGDVAQALNTSLPELRTAWLERLKRVVLDNQGVELARVRFAGSGIFSAVCPHEVAALKRDLSNDLAAGDAESARTTCNAILAADPAQTGTRATLIGLLERMGQSDAALREFRALEGPPAAPAALIAQARLSLADEAFRAENLTAAHEAYELILESPLSPANRRLVEVKALATAGSARQAKLLFGLLVGEPHRQTDGAQAVHLMRELRGLRRDGLAHYLEGRQLLFRDHFEPAARLFGEALELGLPTDNLRIEALRVHAIATYGANWSGDTVAREPAVRRFKRLAEEGDPADRSEASDWLARIAYRNAVAAPKTTARR